MGKWECNKAKNQAIQEDIRNLLKEGKKMKVNTIMATLSSKYGKLHYTTIINILTYMYDVAEDDNDYLMLVNYNGGN